MPLFLYKKYNKSVNELAQLISVTQNSNNTIKNSVNFAYTKPRQIFIFEQKEELV